MPSPKRPLPRAAILRLPTVFHVGAHALRLVNLAEGSWTVSVDDGPPSRTYFTQTEAWEEGVRLADLLDHPRPT